MLVLFFFSRFDKLITIIEKYKKNTQKPDLFIKIHQMKQ